MSFSLSSFLQWRPNIIMCKMIGWNFTYYYITILGRLYFFINRKENWKIKKAIKTVFRGRKISSELRSITKNVFRGIFFHYYEKFFNAYSSARTLENFVMNHMESEGMNAIKQGLEKGKGILLITGHFGGVEYIPAFLGANSLPVSIVVKFKSNNLRYVSIQQANKFLTKIIDADRTPNVLKAIFDNLKANRIVITQCDEIDEWKPTHHQKLSFLGKQIYLDKTINILSKRCGATVVFGVMHRYNNHRYKFIATSYEEIAKQLQRSITMSMGVMTLKFMENYIYKYPEEWYQWKKYKQLDVFAPSGTDVKTPASIPVLKPSLI
jgi:KDO2-lipid IV(A) lauroyltransferase